MVDVLFGTANKKDWNFYYIMETFSLLQVAGLKKVINITRDELFDIILKAMSAQVMVEQKKRPREFWMENTAILQAKRSVISFQTATHATGRNQSQIRV